jgi:hypothetical protein
LLLKHRPNHPNPNQPTFNHPTAHNPPRQSRRPLEDLLDGAVAPPHDPQPGGFASICNTHILQINVSGGQVYRRHPEGAGAAKPVAVAIDEAAAAARAVEAAGGSGRCYLGDDATPRLRRSWDALVAASGGRETDVTVSLRFFGGDRLYMQRALVIDEDAREGQSGGGDQGGSGKAHAVAARRPTPPGARTIMHQPDAPGRVAAAYFDFESLCGTRALARGPPAGAVGSAAAADLVLGGAGARPLSAIDCLALAESGCEAVFLEGVPRLTAERRDAAMRLVTLVDVLYDHGTRGEGGLVAGWMGGRGVSDELHPTCFQLC